MDFFDTRKYILDANGTVVELVKTAKKIVTQCPSVIFKY